MALCVSIAVGSIECDFRSIESNFRSIQNRIESLLKPLILMCSSLFKTFSKHLSFALRSVKESNQFLSFSSIFLQRFLFSYTSKTLLPFFFHLFSLFMHFFIHLRDIFRPMKNLGFLILSFKIDHWVFVVGWYTTIPWCLIWWIGKFLIF